MGLQTKEITPYLPFKLKCQVKDLGKTITAELHSVYADGTCTFCDTVESEKGFEWVKPILVPLRELSAYSNGIKHLGYRTDENNFFNLISDIESGRANYDIMQMCFEEHIDVFSLIKKGLAVDVNTVV
jgi:hypothetical protein